MKRFLRIAVVVAGCALVAGGCGGDDDSSSSSADKGGGGGGDSSVKASWIFTGPREDGGYNASILSSMEAIPEALPGAESEGIFGVPYSEKASKITEQAIANGANMVVETLGLYTLFTDVCKKYPDVACFTAVDASEQGPNVISWWTPEWNLHYAAGVAAGLMTKTGQIGYVGSFEVPVIQAGANSYLLGCQSVRPDCKMRVVYINNYYDPPKATQATETLIDAGVDVMRNYVDDPGFCQVAAKRGVYAVGQFYDFNDVCAESNIMSTVFDFRDYFTEQAKKIDAGTWKGGTIDLVPLGTKETEPHLGPWNDFVPEKVQKQVEEVYAGIVAGDNPIVGPIYDQKGKLRIKDGEVPDTAWLMSKWKWYVKGTQ
jgi:basic membrane protein A